MLTRFRLFAGTLLVWIASKIVPSPIKPAFTAYSFMLEGLHQAIKSGQTYGAVTAPWFASQADRENAVAMQQAAHNAALRARAELQDRAVASDGEKHLLPPDEPS